jgi:hypothetical protein
LEQESARVRVKERYAETAVKKQKTEVFAEEKKDNGEEIVKEAVVTTMD